MKANDLLPYLNRKRAGEMQSLGRELEITALEAEIRGLDVEIEVTADSDGLEAQRAELQIRLEAIKDE